MGTSIGAQGGVAFGAESTYGTAVTPTVWYPFLSEGIDLGQEYIESKAMRPDAPRVKVGSQVRQDKHDPGGPVSMEINNKGFGKVLLNALGGVISAQPNAGTDPTVWDHLFYPAALGTRIGTVEVGWLDLLSNPFSKTLTGAMIEKLTLKSSAGELCTADVDFVGQDMTVATARTAPSLPTGLAAFTWAEPTTVLTLGGVAADSAAISVEINNQLDKDRFYIGGGGDRKQPIAPTASFSAELSADFIDWTAYNRVISGAFTTLSWKMSGDVISHAYRYELLVTMNVMTVGEPPKLTGPGRIPETLKLMAYDDGSGPSSACSMRYRTTDTTP